MLFSPPALRDSPAQPTQVMTGSTVRSITTCLKRIASAWAESLALEVGQGGTHFVASHHARSGADGLDGRDCGRLEGLAALHLCQHRCQGAW